MPGTGGRAPARSGGGAATTRVEMEMCEHETATIAFRLDGVEENNSNNSNNSTYSNPKKHKKQRKEEKRNVKKM